MREAELNRQRVVFTPQEAARLPQDRPYAAYICHYDWAEGEHATLMHCHERLAEVLLILKGSGRYTVDLRPVRGGSRRCGAVQRRRPPRRIPPGRPAVSDPVRGHRELGAGGPGRHTACFPRTAAPCFTSRSSLRT